jgi:quercetin dioxygenase-like cupin family protein
MRDKRNRSYAPWRRGLGIAAPLLLLATVAGVAAGRDVYQRVQPLLSSGQTILGQKIAYPAGASARVTAVIVTLGPGEETGWHTHATPMFGYIIEGELTVDYGPHGTRVYRTGDSLLEAVDLPHNGRNTGHGNTRVLAVSMGALGITDTTPVSKP